MMEACAQLGIQIKNVSIERIFETINILFLLCLLPYLFPEKSNKQQHLLVACHADGIGSIPIPSRCTVVF